MSIALRGGGKNELQKNSKIVPVIGPNEHGEQNLVV